MTAKRSTSKKRSDASGSTQLPSATTFFLDRCFGAYDVAQLLRANGISLEVHKDHFNSDCEDSEWILEVGTRGWAIITKDRNIRSRQIEVIALLKSGQPTFVLTSGNTTAAQNADSILKAMPHMIGCIRSLEAPFVAQITAGGALSILMTKTVLMQVATGTPQAVAARPATKRRRRSR